MSYIENMEVVLMVGIAGSGKTTISKILFPEHKRVSLDEISNSNREVESQTIQKHLENEDNIVIDDTNLTRDIRARHIKLAKTYSARITAVFVDLPLWMIQKQNQNREKPLPDGALFKMRKQLEPPSEDEGFDFIQRIQN